MQLRIFTEPQQGATFHQLARVATAAEELGFDAFFRSDHFLKIGDPPGGGFPGPTDSWVTLGGIALQTSRIRLGTLVTSATFRLPGPLAVSVAEVDQMSGGRVEFGIGSGWFADEHAAYGIPFPELGERFDRLEEQLAVITGLWDTPEGETFSYDGSHYQLVNSPALPKPVQRPHPPVIIGGWGRTRTPRLAARYADEFNVAFVQLDQTSEQFDRVRQACADAGRDASALVLSAAQTVCCGESESSFAERAAAIGQDPAGLRSGGLGGSPAEIVDKLGRFAEAGASRAYLQFLDLNDLDQLELIATKIMSQV
jgi:alkanesulfonate monooxygenase